MPRAGAAAQTPLLFPNLACARGTILGSRGLVNLYFSVHHWLRTRNTPELAARTTIEWSSRLTSC